MAQQDDEKGNGSAQEDLPPKRMKRRAFCQALLWALPLWVWLPQVRMWPTRKRGH